MFIKKKGVGIFIALSSPINSSIGISFDEKLLGLNVPDRSTANNHVWWHMMRPM